MRLIIITLSVLSILAGYYYVYTKRKVLMSLVLTFSLGLVIIFTFNTLGTVFKDWSVGIEICEKTF